MKSLGYLLLTTLVLATGCVSTPTTAEYLGKQVPAISMTQGCDDLGLDQDCSGLSGGTRLIEIEGTILRMAGGQGGQVVFLMSKPKMIPDQQAIRTGGKAVEAFLQSKGINVVETKVMYSNSTLGGVWYRFDGNAYELLKPLTIQD